MVILNYNSYNLTLELIKRVVQFSSIDSICLVDNNSNDNFDECNFDAKVHYIKNSNNLGYSAGNNVGLRYLIEQEKCEILFIANPDTIFENDVIENMKNEMIKDTDIGLISCKRTGAGGQKIHQYFDFPTVKNSIKSCFFISRRKFEKNRNNFQNERVDSEKNLIYVDAVPGSLFGMPKEFILRNNYLYEGIFLYGEEIVVGRQAKMLGYKAAIITSTCYIHNHVQKKFSNLSMFKNDKKSLLKYYKMFDNLKFYEKIALRLSIIIGTIEYSCAYYIYHFLKNEKKVNKK